MTLDESIAATVRAAVAEAVEPLRREVAALRASRLESAPVTITEAARSADSAKYARKEEP